MISSGIRRTEFSVPQFEHVSAWLQRKMERGVAYRFVIDERFDAGGPGLDVESAAWDRVFEPGASRGSRHLGPQRRRGTRRRRQRAISFAVTGSRPASGDAAPLGPARALRRRSGKRALRASAAATGTWADALAGRRPPCASFLGRAPWASCLGTGSPCTLSPTGATCKLSPTGATSTGDHRIGWVRAGMPVPVAAGLGWTVGRTDGGTGVV